MIPYGKQNISQADIEAVVSVLRSDFLTQGPAVPAFEKAVSDYVNVRFAYATNSATSALHIACIALQVGPGDIVWTSPISFVASANCARYCGADVEFVDIDKKTYNMSAEKLEAKLIGAEKIGKLPKVVIPVHLAGQSCDMKKIHELARKYGFRIIEDASHAIGAEYLGEKVGSCKYSDICVFSFHPVKIITTGEGGMVTTNDAELSQKVYRLRSHGITRNPEEMTSASQGPWYYEQLELGYNYRLTDFQAALGLSQMSRLDEFVDKRHSIFRKYESLLTSDDVILPFQSPDTRSSLHLYIIRVPKKKNKPVRKEIFERLRASGIWVNLHYIPIYQQPYYRQFNYDSSLFSEAEAYYSEAISLPMYPDLSDESLDYIRKTLLTPIGHQNLF